MDKDRIAGGGKQTKGDIKDKAGQILGDDELRAEGQADKTEGGVQKVAGRVKDAARDLLGKKH